MDYREKYEEALERAKGLLEGMDEGDYFASNEDIENIFPELKEKESEDERMKKELIEQIAYIIPNNDEVDNEGNTLPSYQERIDKYRAWLEKQGEKKSADKIEPKFKPGDLITNDYCLGKVIEITNDAYLLDTGQGIPFSCEHNAHLWTIADAKDGDVLVNGSNIFIFHYLNDTRLMGYCHMNIDDGRFYDDLGKNECFCLIDAVVNPATKSQCDMLFQKMKGSGYEWDADKKELKKMEVVSKESEDERMKKAIMHVLYENYTDAAVIDGVEIAEIVTWLEKQSKKKSADEVMEIHQKSYRDGYMHGQDNIAISLGKESVEALEHFVRSIGESGYASPYDNRTKLVYRLLEQLKQIVK